jgi:hypothetical protein
MTASNFAIQHNPMLPVQMDLKVAHAAAKKPLVTMHVPKDKFEEAAKICAAIRDKGFPHISLDQTHSAIHFDCHLLCVLKLFVDCGPSAAGFIQADEKDEKSKQAHPNQRPNVLRPVSNFTKNDEGNLLSGKSLNSTRFEVHVEAALEYVKEASKHLALKNNKHKVLEEWIKEQEPFFDSPAEGKELREAMLKGNQDLLNTL